MPRRRAWVKCEDGAKIRTCPKVVEDGDNCYAIYDPDNGDITVADDLPDTMKRKLLHELGHKAAHGMTAREIEAIFGKEDLSFEEREDREEGLCEFLELRLYPLLTRNGWLKLPEPPKVK